MAYSGAGYPIGMAVGLALGNMLNQVDPIDFKCVICKHSSKKHSKYFCEAGIFSICHCKQFILNRKQIEGAEKEIQELRTKLFKNMPQVQELLGDKNEL